MQRGEKALIPVRILPDSDFPFESTEILAYNSVAVRGGQCHHTFSIAVIARSPSQNS
jgi:hypothetical protein